MALPERPRIPIDRAIVLVERAETKRDDEWRFGVGVHLFVGRPEGRLLHDRVQVWLHTKACVARLSPESVPGEINWRGRCECGAVPITYQRNRVWWGWRLLRWGVGGLLRPVAWVVVRVIGFRPAAGPTME